MQQPQTLQKHYIQGKKAYANGWFKNCGRWFKNCGDAGDREYGQACEGFVTPGLLTSPLQVVSRRVGVSLGTAQSVNVVEQQINISGCFSMSKAVVCISVWGVISCLGNYCEFAY